MPSIWKPAEDLARQLRFGRLVLEVYVREGEPYRIVAVKEERAWTKQDLEDDTATPTDLS